VAGSSYQLPVRLGCLSFSLCTSALFTSVFCLLALPLHALIYVNVCQLVQVCLPTPYIMKTTLQVTLFLLFLFSSQICLYSYLSYPLYLNLISYYELLALSFRYLILSTQHHLLILLGLIRFTLSAFFLVA